MYQTSLSHVIFTSLLQFYLGIYLIVLYAISNLILDFALVANFKYKYCKYSFPIDRALSKYKDAFSLIDMFKKYESPNRLSDCTVLQCFAFLQLRYELIIVHNQSDQTRILHKKHSSYRKTILKKICFFKNRVL